MISSTQANAVAPANKADKNPANSFLLPGKYRDGVKNSRNAFLKSVILFPFLADVFLFHYFHVEIADKILPD